MKEVLFAALLGMFLVAGTAFAGSGDWIDKTWCVEVQDVDYCLDFEQGPFGPGLQGDVTLSWLEVDAVVGPPESMDAGKFSQPDPEGNGPILLRGLDLKARIKGETMMLYDDVLKLRAE